MASGASLPLRPPQCSPPYPLRGYPRADYPVNVLVKDLNYLALVIKAKQAGRGECQLLI